jgi:hypothetical protein
MNAGIRYMLFVVVSVGFSLTGSIKVAAAETTKYTMRINALRADTARSRVKDTVSVIILIMVDGKVLKQERRELGDIPVQDAKKGENTPVGFDVAVDVGPEAQDFHFIYMLINDGNLRKLPNAGDIYQGIYGQNERLAKKYYEDLAKAGKVLDLVAEMNANALRFLQGVINPDCDGPLGAVDIHISRADLHAKTSVGTPAGKPAGFWYDDDGLDGVDSPGGCGKNSHYAVSRAIIEN